jgi:hypothetical protein
VHTDGACTARVRVCVKAAGEMAVPVDLLGMDVLGGGGCVHEPRRYEPDGSPIDGFLIDLDGTIYRPGMLIPGAQDFYAWLRATDTPFVLLSNTGAKVRTR